MKPVIAATCVAVFLSVLAAPARAHEGHDHGAPPPPVSASIAPRGEAASETFELLAISEGKQLAIYLDRFATNEPVEGATIEVETPDGPKTATASPGIAYRLDAPWLEKGGKFDLIFTVTLDSAVDVLPVTLDITPRAGVGLFQSPNGGTRFPTEILTAAFFGFAAGALVVALMRRRRNTGIASIAVALLLLAAPAFAHEGETHGNETATAPVAVTRDLPQRLGDGSVFVPKPAQRILALRTQLTKAGSFPHTIELPGRIIPDPNGSGLVQAAVGGRLSPPPSGFPKLGTRVKSGEVLAYVTPPLQAIDVSDMRQRQGELDQQIAIVDKRVRRFTPLAASGAVPKVQLDEAILELEGLRDRRAALDRSRLVPEALVAPVDGIIADGTVVAGQIAPSNMVVYHIVDPAKLWIEALSFYALGSAKKATARTTEGQVLTLDYQGSGFADRNQSVPIQFAITGDVAGLRVGQFVLVQAATDDEEKGVVVPRSSVVRVANGQDAVFEHVTAERFIARPVRTAPLDGENVLILSGIGPDVRVVTQGAELLDQVR